MWHGELYTDFTGSGGVDGTGGSGGDDLDALVRATSAAHDRPGGRAALDGPPAGAPVSRSIPFDVVTGAAETPVGFLFLAMTEEGLAACTFAPEETVVDRLRRAVSADIGPHDAHLDPVRREIDAYFSGRPARTRVHLDLRLVGDFGRVVLRSLLDVPYGGTVTVGDLARRIGRPNARRAVASTLAANPLCLFLPCHRVVADDYPRSVGPYVGGPEAKRRLLELEAAGAA
ncbi:methylated-DNA--[protein]-cysteine S-methyltransferase [Streptomonospora nanhaiensis]|uniref:Methylated-DNA-[protein]-cysteine S-methyltransferase n=2 Tax=Streptomonospora nanhaiensis TaxID=1323731 RepID=A0A853BSR8_9ACTN|nr:methylated-DNA--[protein]-cysteine S-methyltransferase [Streptomonospora nanhaiensis]NYI98020.1 methylated-DNA-[protein]-cysteine S-methyltransferase [Streptomonospora nanhaiensis]